MDREDTIQLSLFGFWFLLVFTIKESILPAFLERSFHSSLKTTFAKNRVFRRWKNVSLTWNYQMFPYTVKKNICINRQKSDPLQDQKATRYLDKFKIENLVYIKRHSSSTWHSKLANVFSNYEMLIIPQCSTEALWIENPEMLLQEIYDLWTPKTYYWLMIFPSHIEEEMSNCCLTRKSLPDLK